MKTRILALALALSPLAISIQAAEPTGASIVTEIPSGSGAPAAVAEAVKANPSLANQILANAYSKFPGQISDILAAVIAGSPAEAPDAVYLAIFQIVGTHDLQTAKTKAAALTQAAIEQAVKTQTSDDAKSKLAAAIAAAAAKAIPGGEQAVQDAAALALPTAISIIRQAVTSSTYFPPARPAIIVSPAQ